MPPDCSKPEMRFLGLGPVSLARDFMRTACSFAYEARRLKFWLKAHIEQYLCTCNVMKSWTKCIEKITSEKKKSLNILD